MVQSASQDPLIDDSSKPYVLPCNWETIEDDSGAMTHRMAVPGGWIVEKHRRDLIGSCPSHALSLCFVPDASHFWKVK